MEEELKEIRFKVIPLWVPLILMILIPIPGIAFDIGAGVYMTILFPLYVSIYIFIFKKFGKTLHYDTNINAFYIEGNKITVNNLYCIPFISKRYSSAMLTINKNSYFVYNENNLYFEKDAEKRKKYREEMNNFLKIVRDNKFHRSTIYNLFPILINIFFYTIIIMAILSFLILLIYPFTK